MAKKKKTQLKPVARGFATTSVPKKVVEVEEDVDAPDASGPSEEVQASGDVSQAEGQATAAPAPADEFDPDKAEEQSLQNLVDKFQEKTEREITRTIKAIEVDRRFAASLPRLDLDPLHTDRILELALDQASADASDKALLEGSEDKVLPRLGITYGVLRRIGFSESRVEECLRSISGVGLDEAYEWLYLHCPEEELETLKDSGELEPKTPRTPKTPARSARGPITPRTPYTPSLSSMSGRSTLTASTPISTPRADPIRLDANAPAFVPSGALSPLFAGDAADQDQTTLKSRILASFSQTADSSADSGRSSPDLDDPHAEYVRLKLQIDALASARRRTEESRDNAFLQELKSRLEMVKKNYFFDERDAEARYRVERREADARALRQRLRGEPDEAETLTAPPPKLSTPGVKKRPPSLQSPQVAEASADIFEVDDEESSGGLLDMLEMPSTVTTDQGVTVAVRDMGNPKQWSGRTPKVLLSETVGKVDRYAAIMYNCVSGPSRAKRASINVRGDGGKSGEWIMEDIACHDMMQAEQYIATVALHALTFPSSEGFAMGSTSVAGGGQTFFRLLPAVFRDLWDELEAKRRASHDTINRGVWAKLRTIVEPKLDYDEKVNGKEIKPSVSTNNERSRSSILQPNDSVAEQIIAEFRSRQASAAYQEMLIQRNQLPIAQYRDEIINTLETSQILVLSGETGCGKSTQLPAFILEDQLSRGRHCKIYCTEPRRISAISLAQRVSRELGDAPGAVGTTSSMIGYSVRLESVTSRSTRLSFVTNGIALRMLEGGSGQGGQGTAFDDITHIIIDEVHERTIESDFLLIVLKSLLQQRSDLKIVLMSATVDADKISNFFGGCPTLHVPGRTFPVDSRYLEDAVEFTRWHIAENSPYARRANDKFYRSKNRTEWGEDAAIDAEDDEDADQQNISLEKRYSIKTAATINLLDERQIPYDLILRLLEKICFEDADYLSYSAAVLIFMPGMAEIRRMNDMLSEHPAFGDASRFRLHPLHSSVSSESQGAVFDIPPYGVRKIVIATNIAETGITIPDITCVIDSGKHREMRFDEKRQLSRLVETFVARSNAAQRRGRAGRVQRGLCFHLFTKVRHDTMMADHPQPEMLRLSLSDLALRIKIMKVQLGTSVEDVLTRAMDPPSAINIQRAVSALVEVRALTLSEEITPMGRLLSKLPTDVHLGKFLLVATVFRCLDPALTIAAALNSKSPFVTSFGREDEVDRAKASFRTENSDFLTIHNVFSSWRRASENPSFIRKFCKKNCLSHQGLQQIEELRQQFMGYLIDASFIQVERSFMRDLSRARFSRNRTRVLTVPEELDFNSSNVFLLNAALAAGLYPKILAIDPASGQMRTVSNNQTAAFHRSSVNHGRRPADIGVHHLSFFTLMQSKKLYAWETGPVDDVALLLLCGDCDFKLISDSAFIDRKIKFHIPPKTNVALKHLRAQLATLLALQFRGKQLTETQILWKELAETVLGKVRLKSAEELEGMSAIVVVNR